MDLVSTIVVVVCTVIDTVVNLVNLLWQCKKK